MTKRRSGTFNAATASICELSLASFLLRTACTEQPGAPNDRRAAVSASVVPTPAQVQTYDDQLLALSAKSPQFAGFVADVDGRVRALWASTDATSVPAAKLRARIAPSDAAAVQEFLASVDGRRGYANRFCLAGRTLLGSTASSSESKP